MNIDDYLSDAVLKFEADVKTRHEDSETADAVWSIGETVARRLHDDIDSLAMTGRDGVWVEMSEAVAHSDFEEDFRFALQARMAYHLMPSFRDVAGRCWDLAQLTRSSAPPEAARRFLSRVARCYLLDLVPECLAMCRGALENGVYSKFSAERTALPTGAQGKNTMRLSLEFAERQGWISSVSASALHSDVWMRGNKAVHSDPTSVGNALGAIALTVSALADMNPPPVE